MSDAGAALDQLTRVLKPGGILLIVDHSAKAGTGSADAGTLHRIDEAYAVRDFEKRGFKLAGKSALLRRPDDARELVSYTPPGLGKTAASCWCFARMGVSGGIARSAGTPLLVVADEPLRALGYVTGVAEIADADDARCGPFQPGPARAAPPGEFTSACGISG